MIEGQGSGQTSATEGTSEGGNTAGHRGMFLGGSVRGGDDRSGQGGGAMKPVQAWVVGIVMASCLVFSGLIAWNFVWQGVTAGEGVDKGRVGEPIRLRLVHMEPPDGVLRPVVDRFVHDIERRGRGRITVASARQEPVPESDDLIAQARLGNQEIVLLPLSLLGQHLPSFRIVDFPFYFASPQAVHHFLDGAGGQRLLREMHSLDLVGLAFWEEGFRQIVADRPIEGPDQLRDMRFGVVPGGFSTRLFSGKGVETVDGRSGPRGENLPDGTVDGWETILTRKMFPGRGKKSFQVQLSHHGWQGAVLAMRWQGYRSLSPEDGALLGDVAQEMMLWSRKRSGRELGRLEQALAADGVAVRRMSEAGRGAWQVRAQSVALGHEETLGPGILAQAAEMEQDRSGRETGKKEWIIGVDADLSGPMSATGLAIKRGVGLAVEEINASGGIDGKSLKMIVTDNRGSVLLGIDNALRLGQKWGAVALVAGGNDPIVSDQVSVSGSLNMLLLVPWAGSVDWMGASRAGETRNRHVFRLAANEYLRGMILLDELIRNPGKVALMLENSGTGRNVRAILTQELRDRGRDKPFVVWFNVGQQVFIDPLRRVRDADVTDLILVAGPEETRHIRRAMESVAFKGRTFFFKGGPVHRSEPAPDRGEVYFETFSLDLRRNRTQLGDSLRKRYWSLFDGPVPGHVPDPSATAQAYDLVLFLAAALRRVPDRGSPRLAEAMERLGWVAGALGDHVWPFSRFRHEGIAASDLSLVQFKPDGMPVALGKSHNDR
ncbi:MAG: TRAP transporter substrate-binding protein DctP [Magnetococcales bacterium]|nr:TRAP transporter substrate-binding protein DctP [Magnetococcales bacterium]